MDVTPRRRSSWVRALICFGALTAMAGCDDGFSIPPEFGLSSARPPDDAMALSQVQLARGAFVFDGPDGWCVEPRSFRNAATQSFALVASCNALTDGRVGPTYPTGYATITIGGAHDDVGTADDILTAVLGETTPRTRRVTNGLARAQLTPDDDAPSAPVWRATMIMSQHPILISVHAPADSAFARLAGSILIDDLAKGLRFQGEDETPAPTPQDAANLEAPEPPGVDPAAFFRRLLNRNGSE